MKINEYQTIEPDDEPVWAKIAQLGSPARFFYERGLAGTQRDYRSYSQSRNEMSAITNSD
jgi:hypothetical protein